MFVPAPRVPFCTGVRFPPSPQIKIPLFYKGIFCDRWGGILNHLTKADNIPYFIYKFFNSWPTGWMFQLIRF